MKKYLITGAGSGLGKFLYDVLQKDADVLTRENYGKTAGKYDTIIHCAFNRKSVTEDEMYQYMNDNLFLTKSLLEHVKYKRFIYISSIDVYRLASDQTLYSSFKRYAEYVVENFKDTLILRLPVLLGNGMKPNHLTKMLEDKILTLASDSRFNYVLYEDILHFILENDKLFGTYDFIANDTVLLSQVAKEFGLKTKFGTYTYITNYFGNPIYTNKTSLETIKEYFKWKEF